MYTFRNGSTPTTKSEKKRRDVPTTIKQKTSNFELVSQDRVYLGEGKHSEEKTLRTQDDRGLVEAENLNRSGGAKDFLAMAHEEQLANMRSRLEELIGIVPTSSGGKKKKFKATKQASEEIQICKKKSDHKRMPTALSSSGDPPRRSQTRPESSILLTKGVSTQKPPSPLTSPKTTNPSSKLSSSLRQAATTTRSSQNDTEVKDAVEDKPEELFKRIFKLTPKAETNDQKQNQNHRSSTHFRDTYVLPLEMEMLPPSERGTPRTQMAETRASLQNLKYLNRQSFAEKVSLLEDQALSVPKHSPPILSQMDQSDPLRMLLTKEMENMYQHALPRLWQHRRIFYFLNSTLHF